MTGRLSKNFHGVGIGPLSKILAVKLSPIHATLSLESDFYGDETKQFCEFVNCDLVNL